MNDNNENNFISLDDILDDNTKEKTNVISLDEMLEDAEKENKEKPKKAGRILKTASLMGAGYGAKKGTEITKYTGNDYMTRSLTGTVIGGLSLGGGIYVGGSVLKEKGPEKAKQGLDYLKKNIDPKNIGHDLKLFGKGTVKQFGEIGKNTATGVATGVGKVLQGAAGEGAGQSLISPFRRHYYAGKNIVKGAFVSKDNTPIEGLKDIRKAKLSNPISGFKKGWQTTQGGVVKKGLGATKNSIFSGTNLVYGGAMAMGVKNAYSTMKDVKQGQHLSGLYTSTPAIPEYDDNSGATGDLVFALHKLRN